MCNSFTEVVNMAISQYDVETLVVLWKPISCLPNSEVVQQTIMFGLPAICAHYGMEDKQYNSLRDFVHDYDRHMFDLNCDKQFNVQRLRHYAEAGDLRNVKIAIEREPNPSKLFLEEGMIAAARGGHRHLVDFFIAKGCDYFSEALCATAARGHIEMVQYLMPMGRIEPLSILEAICESDNVEGMLWALDQAILEKENDWDLIIKTVIPSGKIEVVRRVLELCGGEYDDENTSGYISYAVKTGSTNLVQIFLDLASNDDWIEDIQDIPNLVMLEFLISKGFPTDDWNGVLGYCAYSDDLELMKFLVENGADDYDTGIAGALGNRHPEILKFFYAKMNPDAETASDYTGMCEDIASLKFFIDNGAEIMWDCVMSNSIGNADLDLFEMCAPHVDPDGEHDYILDHFCIPEPDYANEYFKIRLTELGILSEDTD